MTHAPPTALGRPFRILAFDWDGTAVASRKHPTHELRARTERLARLGVWCVVITGTHFGNIDRQYFRHVSRAASILADRRSCGVSAVSVLTHRRSKRDSAGRKGAASESPRRSDMKRSMIGMPPSWAVIVLLLSRRAMLPPPSIVAGRGQGWQVVNFVHSSLGFSTNSPSPSSRPIRCSTQPGQAGPSL